MFTTKDTGGQTLLAIIRQDWNHCLNNNWPMINLFINKVNRTARQFDAVGKSLPGAMGTWKRGKQSRMDIDHPVRESCEKTGSQNPPP